VSRANAGEGDRRAGLPLLDRRPEQHPSLACFVDLVENEVAHRVSVREDDPRVVGGPCHGERPVPAPPERLRLTRREVDADGGDRRLLTRLDGEVRDVRRLVDVDEVRPAAGESVRERLGKSALDRYEVREVVLVPVRVDHHEDLPELREDVEEVSAEQLRVLERHRRREERLGHTPRVVHRVQAQVPAQVRAEDDPIAEELRLDEDARREERLDPLRPESGCQGLGHGHATQEATASSTASGMSKFA
jgi:hypothetical protein